jgi:hypothetical protein
VNKYIFGGKRTTSSATATLAVLRFQEKQSEFNVGLLFCMFVGFFGKFCWIATSKGSFCAHRYNFRPAEKTSPATGKGALNMVKSTYIATVFSQKERVL